MAVDSDQLEDGDDTFDTRNLPNEDDEDVQEVCKNIYFVLICTHYSQISTMEYVCLF